MTTPAIDLDSNPFLLPDQQAMVERIDGVVKELGVNDERVQSLMHGHSQFLDAVRSAGRLMLDVTRFERRARRQVPRKIKTAEDLAAKLRVNDVIAVTRDRTLTMARHFLAMDLGYAAARNDDLHPASELGGRLIEMQASLATQTLLIADRYTFFPIGAIDERVSSWNKAKAAFEAHPKVKPPVGIDEREGQRFDILSDRVRDLTEMASLVAQPKKVSKLRIVNAARGARYGVRTAIAMQAEDRKGIALAREVLESPIFPVVPTLSREDTGDAHRTMRKKIRLFQAAAVLDPALAQDPKVLSYVYLFRELGGRDTSSVKQALEQEAKTVKTLVVKQIRRAEQAPNLDNGSDKDED